MFAASSGAEVLSSEVGTLLQAQKETSEGEATADAEENTAAPAGAPQAERVGAEQEGSRATAMPIGVETPGSGTAEKAAEHAAADGAAGGQAPTAGGTGLHEAPFSARRLFTEPATCM